MILARGRKEDIAIERWLLGEMKEGSAKELETRRAIARRLRHGPLTLRDRVGLAALIDPDTRTMYGWWLVAKRPRGAKRTMDRRRVAAIIWKSVKAGIKQEAAIKDAMEKCKVRSRDKALAAYREYKPIFDRLAHRLKGLIQTD